MSKAVLNSSVVIALSALGHLNKLKHIFSAVLAPRAVYEEICVKGRGLIGERELLEAVNAGLIIVKDVEHRLLVDALLDPLALGVSEEELVKKDVKAYLEMELRRVRVKVAINARTCWGHR